MIWRQDAARETRLPVKQITDERIAVSGKCQRLSDFPVGQQRVFEIHAEVREICARTLIMERDGRRTSHRDEIGGKGTHFQIGGTFAELEGADDRVGNDAKANVFD